MMRFLWSWAIFFVTLCVCQNATQDAQAKLTRALELLQQMPKCAVRTSCLLLALIRQYIADTAQQTCLLQAVAAAGVTAGNIDLAASCANTTATEGIQECAMMTCSIREQLCTRSRNKVMLSPC